MLFLVGNVGKKEYLIIVLFLIFLIDLLDKTVSRKM